MTSRFTLSAGLLSVGLLLSPPTEKTPETNRVLPVVETSSKDVSAMRREVVELVSAALGLAARDAAGISGALSALANDPDVKALLVDLEHNTEARDFVLKVARSCQGVGDDETCTRLARLARLPAQSRTGTAGRVFDGLFGPPFNDLHRAFFIKHVAGLARISRAVGESYASLHPKQKNEDFLLLIGLGIIAAAWFGRDRLLGR